MDFHCLPAAFVALFEQRDVDHFVGSLLRRWPLHLGAVLLAALAVGLLGIVFARLFGKRRRRALTASGALLKELFELNNTRFPADMLRFKLRDPRFKLPNLPILLRDGREQLSVGRRGHPARSRCPLPVAPGLRGTETTDKRPSEGPWTLPQKTLVARDTGEYNRSTPENGPAMRVGQNTQYMPAPEWHCSGRAGLSLRRHGRDLSGAAALNQRDGRAAIIAAVGICRHTADRDKP
jgi:hypothetical protein